MRAPFLIPRGSLYPLRFMGIVDRNFPLEQLMPLRRVGTVVSLTKDPLARVLSFPFGEMNVAVEASIEWNMSRQAALRSAKGLPLRKSGSVRPPVSRYVLGHNDGQRPCRTDQQRFSPKIRRKVIDGQPNVGSTSNYHWMVSKQ